MRRALSDGSIPTLAFSDAFLLAAEHGHLRVGSMEIFETNHSTLLQLVSLLLLRSSVDATNARGETALILASRRGHTHVVRELLKVGTFAQFLY